jgi:hypothetical protein
MARSCPRCGAAVGRLDDDCRACGGKLAGRKPWYIWLLGGFLVLMAFVYLGDLSSLGRFAQTLFDFARGVGGQAP